MLKNAEHPEACPKFQDPQAATGDVDNSGASDSLDQFKKNKTVSQ